MGKQHTEDVSQKYHTFAVDVTFQSRKLARQCNNDTLMVRTFGTKRATVIRRRLTQLLDADTLEDMRHVAGRFHELTGDRKGQWSCDLDQPYRLILSPTEHPIPTNGSGQYIWSAIRSVVVIEIVDYHNKG